MAMQSEGRLQAPKRPRNKRPAATGGDDATPLQVEVRFVTAESLPYAGRLGAAIPVGKGANETIGHRHELDAAWLAREHLASGVVSLLMADEAGDHDPSLTVVAEASQVAGLAFDHFPVRPDTAPTEEELYLGFVTHMVERLKTGENVVLHSGADATRCGMVIGTVLVASGLDPATAIHVVDEMPGDLLTHEPHRTFITDFARSLGIVGDGLAPVVEGCLEARSWRFGRSRHDDGVTFDLTVSTTIAAYQMRLMVRERMRAVTCMFRMPLKVPEERRHAVAALVCHLNFRRWLGAFEMDLRDGDLVFRADIQVVDGRLGPKAVQKTLSAAFEACDAALPKICRVAFSGEAPERVLGLEDG